MHEYFSLKVCLFNKIPHLYVQNINKIVSISALCDYSIRFITIWVKTNWIFLVEFTVFKVFKNDLPTSQMY